MFYIIDRVLTRYERLAKLHSSQTLQSICKSLGHGTFSTKDGVFVRDESVSVFHSSQTLQSDLEMFDHFRLFLCYTWGYCLAVKYESKIRNQILQSASLLTGVTSGVDWSDIRVLLVHHAFWFVTDTVDWSEWTPVI